MNELEILFPGDFLKKIAETNIDEEGNIKEEAYNILFAMGSKQNSCTIENIIGEKHFNDAEEEEKVLDTLNSKGKDVANRLLENNRGLGISYIHKNIKLTIRKGLTKEEIPDNWEEGHDAKITNIFIKNTVNNDLTQYTIINLSEDKYVITKWDAEEEKHMRVSNKIEIADIYTQIGTTLLKGEAIKNKVKNIKEEVNNADEVLSNTDEDLSVQQRLNQELKNRGESYAEVKYIQDENDEYYILKDNNGNYFRAYIDSNGEFKVRKSIIAIEEPIEPPTPLKRVEPLIDKPSKKRKKIDGKSIKYRASLNNSNVRISSPEWIQTQAKEQKLLDDKGNINLPSSKDTLFRNQKLTFLDKMIADIYVAAIKERGDEIKEDRAGGDLIPMSILVSLVDRYVYGVNYEGLMQNTLKVSKADTGYQIESLRKSVIKSLSEITNKVYVSNVQEKEQDTYVMVQLEKKKKGKIGQKTVKKASDKFKKIRGQKIEEDIIFEYGYIGEITFAKGELNTGDKEVVTYEENGTPIMDIDKSAKIIIEPDRVRYFIGDGEDYAEIDIEDISEMQEVIVLMLETMGRRPIVDGVKHVQVTDVDPIEDVNKKKEEDLGKEEYHDDFGNREGITYIG